MDIVIWVAQGLLALMFLMAGIMKSTQSKEFVKEKVGGWVDEYSDSQIKMIGIVEVLGAIGLVLPMVLNVLPVLVPVAAIGLGVTMIAAARLHMKRKEPLTMNLILLALTAFVAIGRFMLVPVI